MLYSEIIECAREGDEKAHDLANTMYSLHKFIEQVVELAQVVKCHSMIDLFQQLSKGGTGTGTFVAQMGELFNSYMSEHLQFNNDEAHSFKEMQALREFSKVDFMKKEKARNEKKERLFRQKDIYRWGFDNVVQLEKMKGSLFEDKDKAFRFMLPGKTEELERAREQLSFYSN